MSTVSTHSTLGILATGDNCLDWYDRQQQGYAGGNAVNVAVSARRAGAPVSYVGAVGTDAAGDLIRRRLTEEHVDLSHLHVEDGATALTHVEIIDGDRMFGDYDEGVMESFAPSAEDLDFAAEHAIFASALWGRTEHHLAEIRRRGCLVAFDIADEPARPAAVTAIDQTDLCFTSRLADDADTRALMESIAHRGPSVVVATLGEAGSLALTDGTWHHCPAERVEVIDTMGAGDSFIGGYLAALLEGAEVPECLQAGTRSAARTLRIAGAW